MEKIQLQTGCFRYSITTDFPLILDEVEKLYSDFSFSEGFIDFDIRVSQGLGLRRWIKPQSYFYLDEFSPFKPLPAAQAYPMLEWGMNWCIAQHAHHNLLMHAAAVEKNGRCLVMPANPGSGKSTLTAALVFNGWRLLSDEISIFSLKDSLIQSLSRPINLKNDSIDIIGNFISDSVFSQVVEDTHKGTVALLKPPKLSVAKVHEQGKLFSYVFPKYVKGARPAIRQMSTDEALQQIIANSFNYHALGKQGFEFVCEQLKLVKCYAFEYSKFEDAFEILDALVSE